MGLNRYRESNLKAYDGPLAERYDDWLPVRLLRVEEMDQFVIDAIDGDVSGLAILDVGCGTGRLLGRLAEAGGRRLCGVDVASTVLDVAKARLGNEAADIRLGDAESRIPWEDNFFDVVACTGALHHFTKLEQAIVEMRRVVSPGGLVIIADACFFTPLRELLNGLLVIHPHKGDFRFYRPSSTSRVLSRSGLQVKLVRRLSWWSYGVCAERPPGSEQHLRAAGPAGEVT
jgi:ubiquinone/menaquinone biosynthesis C-methylase UbiE